MKKHLLVLILTLFCSLVQAQISYTVKAGVAFPKIDGEIFLGDNTLVAIYPEVGVISEINNRVFFSAGLGFKTIASTITGDGSASGGIITPEGDTITTYSTSGAVEDKTTLIYLSVPLYFSYVFDSRYSRSNRYLAFDLGCQPNVNIYSKLSQQASNLTLNPFVFDLIFGVRVGKTLLRSREIELGFRYCYALNGITKKLSGWPISANAVILSVGINFMR